MILFRSPERPINPYITGTMIIVMIVEKTSPPITVIPIGRHISDPSPVLKANGTIPKIVVKAVINTGRSLERPAATIAS